MIKEICFVPHSHTDIGYTHPQPIIFELHRRFLEEAMDLADATAERTDGSAFKWMVEVSGTAIDWWRHGLSLCLPIRCHELTDGRLRTGYCDVYQRWALRSYLRNHHRMSNC